ncbi:hypothetical protein QNM99_29135 [Pseudomonas sp. PCH446]
MTQIPGSLLAELDNHFCLVFAGNLGTAQSVETLVEVADKLRHLSDLRIVLVGSGSMLSWIETRRKPGLWTTLFLLDALRPVKCYIFSAVPRDCW